MQLVLESLPFRAVSIMRLVSEPMHGISRLCAGYERLGGTSRVAKSAIMSNETAKGIFLHVTNSQLESSEHPSA